MAAFNYVIVSTEQTTTALRETTRRESIQRERQISEQAEKSRNSAMKVSLKR
jgi:hypothetical protein